jgi:uncharacterized repeat protein (TIGR01451 family)
MSQIDNKNQPSSNSILSETSIGDDLLATSLTNNKIYAPLAAQITASSILPIPYQSEGSGSEGETQIINLGSTQGIINVSYETYEIPDRLQLLYEGNIIFDTKFESTKGEKIVPVRIPVGGQSTQITSILTANSNTDTEWKYKLNLESSSQPLTDDNGNINPDGKDAVYEFLSKEFAYRTDLKIGDSLKVLYNGTKLSQIAGDYTIDKIFSDGGNTGFYAIGLTSTTQAPVLVLRGTQPTQDNFADILADINPKGIGFNQFEQNSAAPLQWLTDISKSTKKIPDITGHSLGGALAQYFATSSKDLRRKLGDVVTFNSPGVSIATVDKFNAGTGSINRIKYYITNGDIVSLGGENFLPGQYEVLDITNNPIPGIGLYINHVSPVLYPAFYSDGTKLDVKKILESDDNSWLNSDFFTYIDPEFLSTIAGAQLATQAIPQLQVFQAIPPSLLLRGTIEKNRQAIGQDVEKISKEIQNLVDGKVSINLPNQNLTIPGLKIKAEELSINTNGLESLAIRGKVSLPDIFNATADFTGANYIQIENTGVQVVGDLSVKDIKIVPKLWEIKDARIKFDTPNKTVNGSASVLIPSGIIVEGSLGIKSGKLDSIGISASELNRPIATTGAFLQNIGGNVKNLTNLNQIEFGGDVGITAGGKVDISLPSFLGGNISGSLLSLDIKGKINKDLLTGNGKLQILGGLATGRATATLNWNKNLFEADAQLSILDGFISTEAKLRTNSKFDISLYGKSEIRIPNSSPILAGKSLSSGISRLEYTNNDNSSDDFVAVMGKIDIPFIGLQEIGIQIGFDGEYRWNPGKEVFSPTIQPLSAKVSSLSFDPSSSSQAPLAISIVAQPNQFTVQPNTQWLILNSEWDISSDNPVTVRVKSPTGKVINELDFGANNIAIIKNLTDSRNKSIIINKPLTGLWEIEVVDSTGLDNLQYRAFRDPVAPTIQLDPLVITGDSNFTINYKAIDSDSNAKVSLFYSSDNKSFNGTLIKNDLAENDGVGTYSWNTEGLATGDYYVYAMIADGDTAPVFSYAPGQIKVTESDDLVITKTADKESVAIGGNVTYTMVITNNGNSTSKGVILTDDLPVGAKLVSSNISPSQNANNRLTFDLGNLDKGSSKTVAVTISPQATGDIEQDNKVQTIISTSRVTSRTFDPNVNNNTSIVSTSVVPISADLSLSGSISPNAGNLGDDVTYNLVVSNNGTAKATGVVLSDQLPSGLRAKVYQNSEVVSGLKLSTSRGNSSDIISEDNNLLITAYLGDIDPGKNVTVSLTGASITTSDLINNAQVTNNTFDTNYANNFITQKTAVKPVSPTPVDLELTQSASNINPKIGDNVTFTLTLTNKSSSIASGIKITDILPAGLSYISNTPDQGSFNSQSGVWDVGNIRDGLVVKLEIIAKVTASTGKIINNASITAVSEKDPNINNNQASTSITVGSSLPVNNAPIASKPLVNATATQDKPFTLSLPAGAFTDADPGDVLTYSATLANDTALPTWLKLDAATGTFTGTPTNTNVGNLQVKVTATDKAQATANSTFTLDVLAPLNNAPVVSKPLVNASATQDNPFTLALPVGAFTDPDAGDVLTYSATLANGAALPDWLKLDAATGTFRGTPTSTNLGSLQVKVTATDKAQATANSTFALDVVGNPVLPIQQLTLQKSTNSDVWNINGSGQIKVSLLSKNTTQLNEIGIFKVDATNKINGIAPGADGFAKAAIESGSVIFSTLPGSITDGLTLSNSLRVNNGERLGLFLVANGSVEEDLKTNNFSNITTSVDLVYPYTTSPAQVPLQVKENQGAYTLDWKQGDKNLSFNFQVDPTPDTALTSISSQQGQKEGEMLDLRGFSGQNVQATFTMKREAGYNDSVSFYKIDDTAGTITSSNGQKFKPGDSGYVQAALNNAISGLNLSGKNGQTVTVDKVLQGGSLYAPILMSNVTSIQPTGDNAFTAFSLGNADRTDHVRLLGTNTFGFEDLFGGGDKDFNDVVVQASFKTV